MKYSIVIQFLLSAFLLTSLSLPLAAGVPPTVLADLQARADQAPVRLIVQLDTAYTPTGRLSASASVEQAQRIAQIQNRVANLVSAAGTRVISRFRHIPFIVFETDSAGLQILASLPQVINIQEDIPEPPSLASSAPIIGADVAWAGGYTGSGQVIAVIDTGVAGSHPFFSTGSKIVAEGCYSTNDGADITSLCPGGVTSSTAAGSGTNCLLTVRGCDHGTHVAGIALGDDGVGPNTGIARGAKLIPIMVFTRFDSVFSCQGSAPCALSYPSDQVLGLERVLELSTSYTIASVNISIGGGTYADTASCDADNLARKAAIDNLRSVGIATVIASGNSGYKSAMNAPACISSAISVGATTDADSVPSYSNVASFIKLLAPGNDITSANANGGTISFNGTSMATPHVAGAWAVLRQFSPASTVDDILAALQASGTVINDQRNGGTVNGMRRINLDQALFSLGALQPEFESTPAPGSTLPFGELAIGANSADTVVHITNPGDQDLSLGCSLDGSSPASFGTGLCPETIVPSGSADLAVHCNPVSGGLQQASLNLATNDPDEPSVSFNLTCTGTGPEFASTPAAGSDLDFGDVGLNQISDPLAVEVDNAGNQALSVSCSLAGLNAGVFSITSCPAEVPAGSQADFVVTCQPTANGAVTGSLELATNDADENPVSYQLDCRGVSVEFDADPVAGSTLNFGVVDVLATSASLDVQVNNTGNLPLSLNCALSGPHPNQFNVIQCPTTVAAASGAQVQVNCAPDSPGNKTAFLDLATNDSDESSVSFELLCNGFRELYFSDGFEAVDPP